MVVFDAFVSGLVFIFTTAFWVLGALFGLFLIFIVLAFKCS